MTVADLRVAGAVDRPGATSVSDGFVAVGDIMLGDSAPCVGFGFHSRYPHDASAAFASMTSLLRRGEIVIGNLECVLAPRGLGSTRYQSDQMRGDPEYAANLRSAGFTAISIANNHAVQHGIAAFEGTVKCLEAAGIRCVGLRGKDEWCAQPVVQTTRNNLRVGLLGYSWRPRQYGTGEPPYAEGDIESVIHDVGRLRLSTDAVVVSMHWGEEFLDLPSVGEVEAGHRIIDAGASIIVGHHPHVVRPVERYGNGIICYSLGNFVTDMIWQPALRSGAVLECRLSRGRVSDIQLSGTRVDGAFRAGLDIYRPRIGEAPVSGLAEPEYRSRVIKTVRRQRLATYAYAARNVGRYRPAVLRELVTSTLRNKVHGLTSRDITRSLNGKRRNTQQSNRPRRGLSILHIVAPAPFGGLESVVALLAGGQLRRGHSVCVAVVLSPSDGSSHPFLQTLEAENIRTIAIRVGDRDYRGERNAIRSICREYGPDVVHTHGFRSDVVDGPVARAEGIPAVSTCHGFIDSGWRGRLYQWLQRRALRRFDAAIAVSASVEARLRAARIPAARIRLVPNCFASRGESLTREEARRMLRLPDVPLIGWVGRLTNEKGADVALEAFSRLAHPTARLVIIGDGRDKEPLRSRANDLGVGERVHWCGSIPNAGNLFAAFDVFLLSSRSEGTPIALFEAMAADVPIVATRVGGVPDVVDSSCAQLVDSENAGEIAAAVTEILTHPDLSRVRAARARKRLADRFDAEQWLSQYESIYRAVLQPQARDAAQ